MFAQTRYDDSSIYIYIYKISFIRILLFEILSIWNYRDTGKPRTGMIEAFKAKFHISYPEVENRN